MNCFDEKYDLGPPLHIIDCDTCLEPGVIPLGRYLPPGWINDTNGFHCPRCQPGAA